MRVYFTGEVRLQLLGWVAALTGGRARHHLGHPAVVPLLHTQCVRRMRLDIFVRG